MEFVILGLLMIKSFTLYDLNKSFKQGISLFYSASYGSLQFSVKKLLDGNYIEVEKRLEKGRNKKIYSITDSGRTLFLEWMLNGEITHNRLESIALTKLYFLGLMDRVEDKRMILQRIIETITQVEQELVQLDKQLSEIQVPNSYEDVFKYQLMSLNYGIGAHRSSREWFESALRSLEEPKDQNT